MHDNDDNNSNNNANNNYSIKNNSFSNVLHKLGSMCVRNIKNIKYVHRPNCIPDKNNANK